MYSFIESLRCDCPHIDDEREERWRRPSSKKLHKQQNAEATVLYASYLKSLSDLDSYDVGDPETRSSAVSTQLTTGKYDNSVIKPKMKRERMLSDVTDETAETKMSSFSSKDDNSLLQLSGCESHVSTFTIQLPRGLRWAVSHPSVDFTGKWVLMVDPEWKARYDTFLMGLGLNKFIRKIALSLIHRSKEETLQTDRGRKLLVRSINPKGVWDRTVEASGATCDREDYEPLLITMKQKNGESVTAEGWWEAEGTEHRSWMRGASLGDYESVRRLEEGGKVFSCQSDFYRRERGTVRTERTATITWRFQKVEGTPIP